MATNTVLIFRQTATRDVQFFQEDNLGKQHICIPSDKFEAFFCRRLKACRNEDDIDRLHTTVIKNVSVLKRKAYLNEIDRMHAQILCFMNDI